MISKTRILLVDDSPEIRLLLQHMLTSWGYEVSTASSGTEAWEIIQRDQPRLVIADWMMPGLDGPGLCRQIRSSIFPAYIYVILLTARNDTESLVHGIDVGADDFVTKPKNVDGYNELKARIRAGERIIQLWQVLQEQNRRQVELSDRLAIAHEKLHQELENAGRLQRRLLPPGGSTVHGARFEWLFIPSASVSGDMIGFFGLDERRAGFYCIDVAGHGIAASMLSASLSQLLTPEMDGRSPLKVRIPDFPFYRIPPPHDVVAELNQKFQIDAANYQYFTVTYGLLNKATRSLELCVAGLPYPVYLPKDLPTRLLGEGGYPVGLFEQANYESLKLYYETGDRLFICSDGITECRGKDGEMFGTDRLQNFLNGTHELSLKETLKALEQVILEWNQCPELEDDVSVLGIEFP